MAIKLTSNKPANQSPDYCGSFESLTPLRCCSVIPGGNGAKFHTLSDYGDVDEIMFTLPLGAYASSELVLFNATRGFGVPKDIHRNFQFLPAPDVSISIHQPIAGKHA